MNAVYLALAAGVAATTITKAKVFQPMRLAFKARGPWLGYLVSCPYCASHWLVFAGQALYQVRLLHSGVPVADVIISCFPMIGAAAVIPPVLRRLFNFAPDELQAPAFEGTVSDFILKSWTDGKFPEGHFDRGRTDMGQDPNERPAPLRARNHW